MIPKFKIGDWVKTRADGPGQIYSCHTITTLDKKIEFTYKVHNLRGFDMPYGYYEWSLTPLTNEEKVEWL